MVRLSDPPAIIQFGHFSIFPHRRELRGAGRPIRLGGRAFDVLMALIEASGSVVTKDITEAGTYAGNPARRLKQQG